MNAPRSQTEPVSVWDIPTRLFHWSLLAMVILAWRTAETRDLGLHRIAGSAVAGLLVFRLWWGLFGASTARFSNFAKGPGSVLAYARGLFAKSGKAVPIGHNPMGGWSVIALILCLSALVIFGLFAVDTDGIESGPFANLITFDQGRLASHLHAFAFDGLEILVALHLGAILFYHMVKRENLVGAMVTGKIRSDQDGMRKGHGAALAIGLALGLAAGLVLAHLGGAF